MAKPKRITEKSSSEEIINEICKVEEQITIKTKEIKELRNKKHVLNKWLLNAESREQAKKDKETLNRVVALMKEKNLSVNDIEAMLNK